MVSDDHSIDAVSSYTESSQVQTPNIDRIGSEGVKFTNAFVTNSVGGPARATMLTGKYSNMNNYTTGSNQEFNTTQWTFPKELRKNNYWTGLVGSYGLATPQLNSTEGGFDLWNI